MSKLNLVKNIVLFASTVGVVAGYTSAIARFRDNTFLLGFDMRLIAIPILIGWAIFWFKHRRALNDWYSVLLFASALAMVGWIGYLFWFTFIDFIGYLALSLVDISIFSLLYAWAQRTVHQKNINLHKTLSTSFAIIAIIVLSTSLAVTSHVENTIKPVDLSEKIVSSNLKLTGPAPDIEASANLTTQDQIVISSVVSQKLGALGRSNIDLTISDQPLITNDLATLFLQETNITNDFFKRWDVPQNGTYYFLIRYNFVAEGYASIAITRHWLANELVPTQVNTPLLADYMPPILVLGVTFLVGASSIPILRKLG